MGLGYYTRNSNFCDVKYACCNVPRFVSTHYCDNSLPFASNLLTYAIWTETSILGSLHFSARVASQMHSFPCFARPIFDEQKNKKLSDAEPCRERVSFITSCRVDKSLDQAQIKMSLSRFFSMATGDATFDVVQTRMWHCLPANKPRERGNLWRRIVLTISRTSQMLFA